MTFADFILPLLVRIYPSARFIKVKVIKGGPAPPGSRKHVIVLLILAILSMVLLGIILIFASK